MRLLVAIDKMEPTTSDDTDSYLVGVCLNNLMGLGEFEKSSIVSNILEDIANDRMDGLISYENVVEIYDMVLEIINNARDGNISIILDDFSISFNKLNRLCLITKYLIKEQVL